MITFKASSNALCSGTTDAAGKATCSGQIITSLLFAVLSSGYDATYAGDALFLGSGGHGALTL